MPLVLVGAEYAPLSAPTVKPTGNVLWVGPFTETTFLNSLSEIGIVELLVNENYHLAHAEPRLLHCSRGLSHAQVS